MVGELRAQLKDEQLQNMSRNLDEGLPPSEEIEREWQRYEADLDRRSSDAYAKSVLQETAPAQLPCCGRLAPAPSLCVFRG